MYGDCKLVCQHGVFVRKIGIGAGNGVGKSFEAKRKGLDFYI